MIVCESAFGCFQLRWWSTGAVKVTKRGLVLARFHAGRIAYILHVSLLGQETTRAGTRRKNERKGGMWH